MMHNNDVTSRDKIFCFIFLFVWFSYFISYNLYLFSISHAFNIPGSLRIECY